MTPNSIPAPHSLETLNLIAQSEKVFADSRVQVASLQETLDYCVVLRGWWLREYDVLFPCSPPRPSCTVE